MAYPFKEIEAKWQKHWLDNNTFSTPEDTTKPKYYVLDMFPYPSGAGLHVGHPEGYTATDIIARYKRMQGYNVLHPMGWDAFGLPAERYAMQTNIHPAITTEKNINNFRRQLQALGFSYDWQREVNTTEPGYYKFTQFIFLKIFNSYFDEKEQKAKPIEELEIPAELQQPGKEAEREQYINDRRLAYIADIPVNWCAELGTVLANEEVDEWVEKGYTVERRPMRQWMLRITAYAERLLEDLKMVDWPQGTLELQKNWIGRSEGAEVDFKIKNSSEVLRVFTTRPDTLYGATYMVVAPEHRLVGLLTSAEQKKEVDAYLEKTRLKSERDRMLDAGNKEKTGVFTGGFVEHPLTGEDVPVWVADYVLMGYGTGAIMAVPAHDTRDFEFATFFNIPIIQVVKSSNAEDELPFTGDGTAINSDIINGLKTADAKKKMIDHIEAKNVGQRKINFKLRDWLFSRQRYWGEPIPVSFTESGSMVAEAEENLPLLLPESDNFQPAETGESPLANLKDWVNYEKDGVKYRRETNTMPQWAGSCWYYLRYIDPHNSEAFVDKEKENYWMSNGGVDLYVGGAEHAVLHLLYARFWHKVLFDYGLVSSAEPFKKLIHQGIILGEDGSKMSKSRGNVVNPDTVLEEYGADSFRLYEMFMGPLEQMKPWSSKAIDGVYRFLSRVWKMYINDDKINDALFEPPLENDAKKIEKVLHQTIIKVTQDIETMSFNTAISQMMIFMNELSSIKSLGKETAETFLKLLNPLAPHITEEIWAKTGHDTELYHEAWPVGDPEKAKEDEIEIVFQVKGKIKGKQRFAPNTDEEVLKKAALANEGVQRALDGKEPKKVIVVKNKIVSIVV